MDKLKVKAHSLLRQSERIFKTDMVYLARGGFWLTFGQFLGSVSSFVLALVLARFISKETYGTYKYILSIAGTLTLFSLKGMDAAMTQAAAHNREGSFGSVLKAKIKFGLIGSAIALGLSAYYFYHHNTLLALSFGISGIFIAVSDSLFLYDSLLQGKQRFKTSTLYSVISQVTATVVIGTTAVLTKNVYAMVFAYFVIWTIMRGFFLLRVLHTEELSSEHDERTVSYGIHTSVINGIATLSGSIDSILIFHFLGPAQLAVYTFALAPVSQIRMLTDKIPTLAMPKFARRPISELKESLKGRTIFMGTLAVMIVGLYIAAAPALFKVLFPQYVESVSFSQIFSLIIMVYMPYSILGAILTAKLTHIPAKLLYLWNIPNIIMTLAVVVLVAPFGVMGVILSRLISAIATVGVGVYIWNQIKHLPEEVSAI